MMFPHIGLSFAPHEQIRVVEIKLVFTSCNYEASNSTLLLSLLSFKNYYRSTIAYQP